MPQLSDFSRTLLRQLILNRQSELDHMASSATNPAERTMISADRAELCSLWEEVVAKVAVVRPPESPDEDHDDEPPLEKPKRRGRPPRQAQ